jgi:hypothetical protein
VQLNECGVADALDDDFVGFVFIFIRICVLAQRGGDDGEDD